MSSFLTGWANLERQKVEYWLPRTGGRKGERRESGYKVSFEGDENVLQLNRLIDAENRMMVVREDVGWGTG